MAKNYKSTRAKNYFCNETEKAVSFYKDDSGYWLITKNENGDTIGRNLAFTDDCIIIKSVHFGTVRFVSHNVVEDKPVIINA